MAIRQLARVQVKGLTARAFRGIKRGVSAKLNCISAREKNVSERTVVRLSFDRPLRRRFERARLKYFGKESRGRSPRLRIRA